MSTTWLLLLYLAIGMACGVAAFRHTPDGGPRRVASALAAVALWPLWAPFALMSAAPQPQLGPTARRIQAALAAAREAIDGTALASSLRRDEAADLVRQVQAAEQRLLELERHIAPLGAAAAGDDARSRLHAGSLAELEAMRSRERRALAELAELAELLRTQLVLARFGGSERAGELRDELWARVAALSEAERVL